MRTDETPGRQSLLFGALFFTLLGHDHVGIHAFTLGQTSTSLYHHTVTRQTRYISLHAKPPPISHFDLDAIEEFESSLLASETIFTEDNDKEYTDDDDDSTQEYTWNIPPELDQKRIDAALALLVPEWSRSFCGTLVSESCVKLCDELNADKIIDRKSFKVESGQGISVSLTDRLLTRDRPTAVVAQDLPLHILYEDEFMIVLNKAAHMVVHPAVGNWDGTVVNALAYYLPISPYGSGEFVAANEIASSSEHSDVLLRPGIVHRLDKGTTGVLVVAKTRAALATLSEAFAARTVKKTYLAITVGNPGKQVTIDKPIGRHPIYRQRMRVVPDPHRRDSSGSAPKDRLDTAAVKGRRALSYVDTLAFDGKLSLVQVQIATGRTHQIRVHLQDRHTPIYGDDVYGLKDWNKRLAATVQRPLLHAYQLELVHPITQESMVFTAPLPEDMKRVAKSIYPQGVEERPDLFE